MVPIYGGVVVQGHCSVEGLGSHNTNDLGIHSKVFEGVLNCSLGWTHTWWNKMTMSLLDTR